MHNNMPDFAQNVGPQILDTGEHLRETIGIRPYQSESTSPENNRENWQGKCIFGSKNHSLQDASARQSESRLSCNSMPDPCFSDLKNINHDESLCFSVNHPVKMLSDLRSTLTDSQLSRNQVLEAEGDRFQNKLFYGNFSKPTRSYGETRTFSQNVLNQAPAINEEVKTTPLTKDPRLLLEQQSPCLHPLTETLDQNNGFNLSDFSSLYLEHKALDEMIEEGPLVNFSSGVECIQKAGSNFYNNYVLGNLHQKQENHVLLKDLLVRNSNSRNGSLSFSTFSSE